MVLRTPKPSSREASCLQRRRGEGRDGIAPDLAALRGGDTQYALTDPPRGFLRNGAGLERPAIELACVEFRQPRDEAPAALGRHVGVDGPVFLRLEGLDLGLAGADQA